MPTKKKRIAENIVKAKREIADAEADLDKLIGAIRTLPRAQKVNISEPVADAFDKLKSAQRRLADLEDLLKSD